MITIPTNHIYNYKRIVTVESKTQEDVRDKFIGNYSHGLEKQNIEYIKKEFKL